mgnify:CR=1 FL=1
MSHREFYTEFVLRNLHDCPEDCRIELHITHWQIVSLLIYQFGLVVVQIDINPLVCYGCHVTHCYEVCSFVNSYLSNNILGRFTFYGVRVGTDEFAWLQLSNLISQTINLRFQPYHTVLKQFVLSEFFCFFTC